MLFFQEYVAFDAQQWVLFPFGVVLTVAGVISLAARHSAQSPPPSPSRSKSPTHAGRSDEAGHGPVRLDGRFATAGRLDGDARKGEGESLLEEESMDIERPV